MNQIKCRHVDPVAERRGKVFYKPRLVANNSCEDRCAQLRPANRPPDNKCSTINMKTIFKIACNLSITWQKRDKIFCRSVSRINVLYQPLHKPALQITSWMLPKRWSSTFCFLPQPSACEEKFNLIRTKDELQYSVYIPPHAWARMVKTNLF